MLKFFSVEQNPVQSTSTSAWCAQLYDEILLGKFVNGVSTELLCHSRNTGKRWTVDDL